MEDETKDLQAEVDRLTAENQKLKDATTAASADAAKWKREAKAHQTEAEQKDSEQKEAFEKMQSDLKTALDASAAVQRENSILKLSSKLAGDHKFDSASASEMAEAIVSGDADKILACMGKHDSALETLIKAELAKGAPKPDGSSGGSSSAAMEQVHKLAASRKQSYETDIQKFIKR